MVAVGLGSATAAVSRSRSSADPENLKAAEIEIAALQRDFSSGRVRTRCGIHKRVYTFKERYGQKYLLQGEFAGLVARGLPAERADFLLDPWNSPYWIRHRCEQRRRRVFVYSFGPNRRRDSTRWEILDDDVGAYIGE